MRLKHVSFHILSAAVLLAGCKSEEQKFVEAEISRSQEILNEIHDVCVKCQDNLTAENVFSLEKLCSNQGVNVSSGVYNLTPELKQKLIGQQHFVDSVKTMSIGICEDFVEKTAKVIVEEDVLVDGQKVYPMYLKKGSSLIIRYSPSGAVSAKLYNADSRTLLKTYGSSSLDTLHIVNSAIYLFELTAATPQYASVGLYQKVTSMSEFMENYPISVEKVETTADAFRARKIPGVDLKPVFEEPHKFTIRCKLKNFVDTSSPFRSVAALKVPAGASDILYHLRISTSDDGKTSDGKFFNDVYTRYKSIKFLGLPLYESTKQGNGLLRELLNGLQVQREEKAYCNLYVFTSAAQAKSFQSNTDVSKLSYNMDYSATGTQSRNERIPAKGFQTIYLGFENIRQTHDIYIWVEAIATIPKDVWYTEKYSLEQ